MRQSLPKVHVGKKPHMVLGWWKGHASPFVHAGQKVHLMAEASFTPPFTPPFTPLSGVSLEAEDMDADADADGMPGLLLVEIGWSAAWRRPKP